MELKWWLKVTLYNFGHGLCGAQSKLELSLYKRHCGSLKLAQLQPLNGLANLVGASMTS